MKTQLWRWILKRMRLALDAADEWLHAQEAQFREARAAEHAPQGTDLSVDRRASAAREKMIRKTRAARPRLKYQDGQFVRQN